MEREVLDELQMYDRNEVVTFLKELWKEHPTPCPKCGQILETLHKKAKKSNNDWICKDCNTIYRTIDILKRLNEQ